MKILRWFADLTKSIWTDYKSFDRRRKFVFCLGFFICIVGILDLITLKTDPTLTDVFTKFAEMLTIMGVGLTILIVVDTSVVQEKSDQINRTTLETLSRIEDKISKIDEVHSSQIQSLNSAVKGLKHDKKSKK